MAEVYRVYIDSFEVVNFRKPFLDGIVESTDETKFSAKASTVSLEFLADRDALDLQGDDHLVRIMRDSDVYWLGFLDMNSLSWKNRGIYTGIWKVKGYSMIKKLSEFTIDITEHFLGETIADLLEKVADALAYFIDQKFDDHQVINPLEKADLISDVYTDEIIENGICISGVSYEIRNKWYNHTDPLFDNPGLCVAQAYGHVFGVEALGSDAHNRDFCFIMFQGALCRYFMNQSDDERIEKDIYPGTQDLLGSSGQWWAVNVTQEYVVFYCRSVYNVYYYVFHVSGHYHGDRSPLVVADYSVNYVLNLTSDLGDAPIYEAVTGIPEFINNKTITREENTYEILSQELSAVQYSGALTWSKMFPYVFEENPTGLRLLEHLSVFFDGMFYLQGANLCFVTSNNIENADMGSSIFIDEVVNPCKYLQYDLSDNTHEYMEDYTALLTDYYMDRYGGMLDSVKRKYRGIPDVNLEQKIDNLRIVEIKKKKNYTELKLIGG